MGSVPGEEGQICTVATMQASPSIFTSFQLEFSSRGILRQRFRQFSTLSTDGTMDKSWTISLGDPRLDYPQIRGDQDV